MTLNEFNEEIVKAMVAFQNYWACGHEKQPDHFPEKLDEDQWWEQFMLWLQDWGEAHG